MPMDAAFVGRSFPFARAYQVGAEKVREFAAAVGEANPLCRDQAAAGPPGIATSLRPPPSPSR